MSDDLKFIRGVRVLRQLNEDSTEPDLYQNITQAFPETRKRHNATNEVTIQNVQYIPYVGTKFLHVKSTSVSNGHQYKQAVQFMRVQFESEDSDTNVTYKATDGKDYHMQQIDLGAHNIKVRCNCLDFYYRFATWNYNDNSIVGPAPRPYRRKTTTRPEVNPSRVPGLCKHLLKLIQNLQSSGLVK